MKKTALLVLVFSFFLAGTAKAEEFSLWIDNLIKEANGHGITLETAYNVLSKIDFNPKVIELQQAQPEKKITAEEYWGKMINTRRIERARSFYNAHRVTLNQIGDMYNVQPRFIVALLAMESDFGEVQGGYNVVAALASLAYQGDRADYFKSELFDALKILDKHHVDRNDMMGSWAGAMGWCQFMPSSFLKYAVDYDADGRTDIWNSFADAAASAANYLHENGWRTDEGWGVHVRITRPIPEDYIGRDIKRKMSDWAKMGVRNVRGKSLGYRRNVDASLIYPDGSGGDAFLVFNNFDIIMQWNKSTYFATTIGMIADKIGGK